MFNTPSNPNDNSSYYTNDTSKYNYDFFHSTPTPSQIDKKIKLTKTLGIICLVLGVVSTLCWILINPTSNPEASGIIIGLIYIPLAIIVSIICLILLIICLKNISKYKFQDRNLWAMPTIGMLLSVSFWIFFGIYMMAQ